MHVPPPGRPASWRAAVEWSVRLDPIAAAALTQCCGGRERERSSVHSFSYLVDPASSHMLLSRTKPCKCQMTRTLCLVGLRMAHCTSDYLPDIHMFCMSDTRLNQMANTCTLDLILYCFGSRWGNLAERLSAVSRNKHCRSLRSV